MRKASPLLLAILLLTTACSKPPPTPAPVEETGRRTTPSGLTIIDLSVGSGTGAQTGDEVTVDYTGALAGGRVFDSSSFHGVPFKFVLGTGSVIKGWDEGVVGMKVGGKRRLIIPGSLAYGERGAPDAGIEPNATLTFDIDLRAIAKSVPPDGMP